MNFGTIAILFCGIAWNLASSESSLKTPQRNIISQPDLNCAFEGGLLCSWKDLSTSDELRWEAYNRRSNGYFYGTGPHSDHTTGHGYFLAMRTSFKYEAGKAILESPQIITYNDTCLSFWYFMHGYSVSGLNVYKISQGDTKTQLFAMFGPQGKRWYRTVINTGYGDFKLQIEATYIGKKDYGDIAIDDIMFSYHACQEDASKLLKDQPRFDCDFEHDFCSWFYHDQDSLTWRMRNVSSSSLDRNALPPESNGTSYIEVVKTSRHYTQETKLQGPTISVDSRKACLSFWYKINGSALSRFLVQMYDHGQIYQYGGKAIFSTHLNSGPVWIQGLVTLPEGDNFYLTFHVSSYRERAGTFALDDIHLTRGQPCIEDEERLVNCDFERDFCRWYMKSKKDEGDWLRIRGPTPTNSTGPLQDHTTGDGHYIFLDASNVEEANLYSSPFSVNSSGACLSFWYYMYGVDVNTLQLRSVGKSYGFSGIDWSKKGPQGDQWLQQNISLNAGYNIHLIFTAKRSYFPRGDIALDDIRIKFGAPCEGPEKEATTMTTTSIPEIAKTDARMDSTKAEVFSPTTTTEKPSIETPRLLVQGNINPAFNNSRVELLCQHNEEGVWIRWYKRNDQNEKEEVSEAWEESLVFEEIHPKDSGIYSCVVQSYNSYPSNESNEVEIIVVPDTRPSPTLEIDGDKNAVHDGYPVDVQVDAVIKLVCGDEINGGEYHWKTTSNVFNSLNLPKDRILVLNGTQPKHSGVYSCRISKDTYMTAKSNEVNIAVRPGRWCEYEWNCYGDTYYLSCEKNRCKCRRNAALHGKECLRRPEIPKITTSPDFFEFSIGESFYLVCDANEPAPANLTYSFKKWYHGLSKESLNIMKITNATEGDSGSYSCYVNYNGIESKESKSIYIQIQDFIDLNCDFAQDLCTWFQENGTDTADFITASPVSDDHGQSSESSVPFLQLNASNTTVPNRAMLVSPTIERMALDSCLTFWYRMHGPDVYSLSVWRYLYSGESERFGGSKLWTVIGDKGDVWFKQSVTVGNGTKFYIAFDAIGQVAIDDILFTYRGGC